ncbi:MAG TPA: phosphotransferase family protein [Ilumatobacteraceae bacterium]|nr:phosphotransferase family protein [Ilumatobacteraceae bacterium]
MAVPTSRDPAVTELQLARFLQASRPEMSNVSVSLLPSPRSTGFSSETLLFDATYTDPAGAVMVAPCVARIRPADYTLYQDHDLESQWRVIDALSRHTDVPVPRILAHDAIEGTWLGQQCFVMDRIDGAAAADLPPYTVKGWLKDSSAAEQRQVYVGGLEVLAGVHAADWRGLGLGFLQESTANPVGLQQQLEHDERFLGWVTAGREFPELQRASAWLRANLPDDGELLLSWGDARLGNMLFRDHRPVAVLDWEMVTLAAPGADLGWWLVFNLIHSVGIDRPSLPGIPTDDEAVGIYESVAGRTVTDLIFYEVRAALRAALLLIRFSDAMVENGSLPPEAAARPYTPAVKTLTYLLAR